MTDPSLAQRLFDMYTEHVALEDTVFEALIAATGVTPSDLDAWPLDEWTYDWYDGSFEATVQHSDWRPSKAVLEAWAAVGFDRCWLHYNGWARYGGTEVYYALR